MTKEDNDEPQYLRDFRNGYDSPPMFPFAMQPPPSPLVIGDGVVLPVYREGKLYGITMTSGSRHATMTINGWLDLAYRDMGGRPIGAMVMRAEDGLDYYVERKADAMLKITHGSDVACMPIAEVMDILLANEFPDMRDDRDTPEALAKTCEVAKEATTVAADNIRDLVEKLNVALDQAHAYGLRVEVEVAQTPLLQMLGREDFQPAPSVQVIIVKPV